MTHLKKLRISVAAVSLLGAAIGFAMPAVAEGVIIGFSQASSNSAHRNTMTERNRAYAEKNFADTKLIITNAEGKTNKQISDVESLLVQGIQVLMISPQDTTALSPIIKEAMSNGVKVVTLERAVETPVTLHIGPKNYPIGVKVGEFLKDKLGGKGNVVEIKGDPAVAPAVERNKGFRDAIAGSEIKVIAEQHADWDQEKALKFMEDTLQRFGPGQIQAVYAHNDNMAFGALKAIEAAGRGDEGILIVGIDGENGAIRAVMDGKLAATFTYSTVAPEGIIAAHALAVAEAKDLLPLGAMTIEIPATLVTKDNAESLLCTGFGDDPKC
jgi:ribose transport system substrate-binding protein